MVSGQLEPFDSETLSVSGLEQVFLVETTKDLLRFVALVPRKRLARITKCFRFAESKRPVQIAASPVIVFQDWHVSYNMP